MICTLEAACDVLCERDYNFELQKAVKVFLKHGLSCLKFSQIADCQLCYIVCQNRPAVQHRNQRAYCVV